MTWISVNNKKPKIFQRVLACSNTGYIAITCRDDSGEFDLYPFVDDDCIEIKYWKPLPTIPVEIIKPTGDSRLPYII